MIDGRMQQHHGIVGEGRDGFTGAVYFLDTVGCASTGVGIRGERSVSLGWDRSRALPLGYSLVPRPHPKNWESGRCHLQIVHVHVV